MEYTLQNGPDGKATRVVIGGSAFNELKKLAEGHTKIALITDKQTDKHCFKKLHPYLPTAEKIILPDGEAIKSLARVEDTLKHLRESGFDRKSLIIGLGGGVVNDLAGFCASTYMRGIDWVMIPSTLTAQADASIGGKTGVNLGGYKNMVGSFWPSRAVLINPVLLETLPKEHLMNGLAEIIKMGFIYDPQILEHVSRLDPAKLLGDDLDTASRLAARGKIEIVNTDPYEAGGRKLLNFGHTVGHALEAISMDGDKPLLHGEAISIGMAAETKLAELESVCAPGLSAKVKQTLKRFGLPVAYPHASLEDILGKITSDKKNVGGAIRWTLPENEGRGVYDHEADEENIKTAIGSILS
ncbi:MAG TPA: 3-dehydroquinate synthase [Candidatus Saccharimonadales bacterium]|nr:3-dehydroquinate synthase [Candidatus Saccharimonadales bacterium]